MRPKPRWYWWSAFKEFKAREIQIWNQNLRQRHRLIQFYRQREMKPEPRWYWWSAFQEFKVRQRQIWNQNFRQRHRLRQFYRQREMSLHRVDIGCLQMQKFKVRVKMVGHETFLCWDFYGRAQKTANKKSIGLCHCQYLINSMIIKFLMLDPHLNPLS